MKWYVIQVTTGKELDVLQAVKRLGYLAVVPQEMRYIHSNGTWSQKLYTLFEGYVFIQCTYDATAFYAVQEVPNFIKWLGVKSDAIPLKPLEVEWILLLANKGEPLPPSQVTINKNGKPICESEVLSYIPNKITKLGKHTRKAYVSLELAGETRKMTLSVDIIDVSEAGEVDSSPTAEVADKS